MNVKLLRKVKKHILEEPKRYDQNKIIEFGTASDGFPACGTMACIGGWAQLLTYKRRPKPTGKLNFPRLRRELGLDNEQLYRLTAYTWDGARGLSWPEKFREAYEEAKTPKTRAKIAAERIEHFIATKGAE